MKVLITGGSGLLGSAVSFHFRDYFQVTSTYTSHKVEIDGCKTIQLDITYLRKTIDTIKKIKPEIIIHTAALVGVGICEKNPVLAKKINVEGTRNIVEAAKKTDSKIIYISTDYVFDGKKGNYSEEDKPNPINIYGKTKYGGEILIDTQKDAIIRTSIYGWNIIKTRRSFSTWIIEDLRNNKHINVFADNINSMMLANNFAEALKEFIDKDLNGITNIASSEKISKYDFAITLADIFKLDKDLVNPIKNDEAPGADKRPLDVSLSTSKSRKELKTRLLSMEANILKLRELEASNYLKNFKVI